MSKAAPEWYLKKKNNTQYGPVTIDELIGWARECRIVAGNQASTDQQNWIPVEDIPALQMDWLARRQDGKQFGPFPLSALPALQKHRVLPPEALLSHRHTQETRTMADALLQLQDPPTSSNRTQTATTTIPNAGQAHSKSTPPLIPADSPAPTEAQANMHTTPADSQHQPASATPVTQTSETNPLIGKMQLLQTELDTMREANKIQADQMAQQAREAQTELDTIRTKLENALQQSTERRQQEQQKQNDLQQQIETLQEALAKARHESDHAQTTDATHENTIAELRQQVAFMKKNVSALNGQLLTARHTAAQRAKMLVFAWISVTCITAAGIVMLFGRGCRRETNLPLIEPHTQTQKAPRTAETLPPITARTGEQRNSTTAPHQTSGPATTVSMHELQIQAEGVEITSRNPNMLALRFSAGIFSSLDTLSPEGRSLLDTLARQLPRNRAGWQISIHGHTDNIPMRSTARFADNSELAQARADVVAQHFIRRAGFPTETITTHAGTTAPFPNDTAENRIRNRTVTIEIKRSETN
ncbi:MAG: OmpA family protein [Kiritimatiellia bacterium]